MYYHVAIPKKIPLPQVFQEWVNKYNQHLPASGSGTPQFASLREFAKYIRDNRTGSCFHRSIAFYDQFVEKYGDTIRIVQNDVHAMIEMKINGRWHKLDLGGYPANLKKLEPEIFKPIAEEKGTLLVSIAAASQELSQFFICEKPLAEILIENQPTLVHVNSDIAVKEFYTQLRTHTADIFIAHRPEDLSLTATGLSQDGTLTKSKLQRWLKPYKQGVICVDIRDFNDEEVAQLNDLLDRTIENIQLPDGIGIKLIDHPDRHYGPDFRRRVTVKTSLSTPSSDTLLEKTLPEEKEGRVEIDLFNSSYWQRAVMGAWRLKPSEDESFSFYWEVGPLLEALQSPETQQIVFKNPPLHDPTFTTFVAELQALRRIEWVDQIKTIPKGITFYQSTGLDWQALSRQVSLRPFTPVDHPPYVLSNANLLSFIQDSCYEFAKNSHHLITTPCYLDRCKAKGEAIDVVCAHGLSVDAVAQFLAEAQKRNVPVHFLMLSGESIPACLSSLHFKAEASLEQKKDNTFYSHIEWQIHEDIYFAERQLLVQYPGAFCFDLSCLEPPELGRFPILPDAIKQTLLKTGKFAMRAELSSIIQKLKAGETVILSGKIPPSLYEALTTLNLGFIEAERIKGKLIILTPPEEASAVHGITGRILEPTVSKRDDKIRLLAQVYSAHAAEIKEFKRSSTQLNFATLERQFLQFTLQQEHNRKKRAYDDLQSDKEKARIFDANRLVAVQAALKLNPWVMLPGLTGIGKSYFMQNVLPQKEVCFRLEEWLQKKPAPHESAILIIDEASFASQLNNEGENFLERFKSLRNNPPGFLWKGHYYELTSQHKIIFAFNPASYGAGRSTAVFLSEHALTVSFRALPDFYIRAHLITPLLKKILKRKFSKEKLRHIADPLMNVYRWIIEHSPANEILMTPRSVKAMANLVASRINKDGITDPSILNRVATEVAFNLGRQALVDHINILTEFNKHFAVQPVRERPIPKDYLEHQREVYWFIQDMLQARASVLAGNNTDLGLGGILLEGASAIGKSHFVRQIVAEYQSAFGEHIYRISPTTPFHEKEKVLRKAFDEGALVVAEEMNTSIWPNKLLNYYLMGQDEHGKPAKKPGFFLIATQNFRSFAGRRAEDPAQRLRQIKYILDWPIYKPPALSIIKKDAHHQNDDKKRFYLALALSDYKKILKPAADSFFGRLFGNNCVQQLNVVIKLQNAIKRNDFFTQDLLGVLTPNEQRIALQGKLGEILKPFLKARLDEEKPKPDNFFP